MLQTPALFCTFSQTSSRLEDNSLLFSAKSCNYYCFSIYMWRFTYVENLEISLFLHLFSQSFWESFRFHTFFSLFTTLANLCISFLKYYIIKNSWPLWKWLNHSECHFNNSSCVVQNFWQHIELLRIFLPWQAKFFSLW